MELINFSFLGISGMGMHAKSLQSCLTLCDPIDNSPPGSSIHRILQARTLEWVTISFSIDLNYCEVEWLALETNRDRFIIFEVAPKSCISDSFVDYEGYSVSSMGFLPTVVNTMFI